MNSHLLKKIVLFFTIFYYVALQIVHLSRPYSTFWMPTFHILVKSLLALQAVKFHYVQIHDCTVYINAYVCTNAVGVYHTGTSLQTFDIQSCTFNSDNTVVTDVQYSQTQCCADSFDIDNVVTRQRKLKKANQSKFEV